MAFKSSVWAPDGMVKAAYIKKIELLFDEQALPVSKELF
jgi:hypothetical protein